MGNAQNSFNNSCIFIICHKLCFCLRTLHSAKGNPEREAILNALREKLKEFPDKEPSSINFEYKRKDVGVAKWFIEEGKKIIFIVNYLKVKDNWAWIEVSGANYSIDIDSLLYKEKGKWSCDCQFFSLKQRECSHILACKLFLDINSKDIYAK